MLNNLYGFFFRMLLNQRSQSVDLGAVHCVNYQLPQKNFHDQCDVSMDPEDCNSELLPHQGEPNTNEEVDSDCDPDEKVDCPITMANHCHTLGAGALI